MNGTPSGRKKAVFLNFSGVVWTRSYLTLKRSECLNVCLNVCFLFF